MERERYHPERGNVFFYILIGVILFAALGFAISQSNRGSVAALDADKARLLSAGVIEYANTLAAATAQLRLRGFGDTGISFQNAADAAYAYDPCGDNTCMIFHLSGGGVTYQPPASGVNDGTGWYITGSAAVTDIGLTGTADLVAFLPDVGEALCIQINNRLGVGATDAAPPTDTGYATGAEFTGTYPGGVVIGDEAGGTSLKGKTAGCFQSTTDPTAGSYHFYRVLVAR